MTEVHIVIGSVGCYSDRDEWPVAAYEDLLAAQSRAHSHVDNPAHLICAACGHDWIESDLDRVRQMVAAILRLAADDVEAGR